MQPAPKITDVFAEHGVGFCRYTGAHLPTTFLYGDEGKRRQLGWERGLIADGAVIPTSFADEYRRVHLIGAAQVAKAA
jgi:hypothetical protein